MPTGVLTLHQFRYLAITILTHLHQFRNLANIIIIIHLHQLRHLLVMAQVINLPVVVVGRL